MSTPVRWLAAYVPTAARRPWCFGPPRETAAEARADLKARLASGDAGWGCLVKMSGGRRTLLWDSILPPSPFRSIVEHWERLRAESPEDGGFSPLERR